MTSEAPASDSAEEQLKQSVADTFGEGDAAFVISLRAAGILNELDSNELERMKNAGSSSDAERRQVDYLERYYTHDDEEIAMRRRRADRYFIQCLGEPATARGLVARLSHLAPELSGVELDRIGGDDGPLVLKAGEHFSAVLDDHDEEGLEMGLQGVPMVTVRGLVRALNVLLDRNEVRERLVSLRGDDEREVYVALGVAKALELARLGLLEDDDPEDVMELGAW